MYAIGSGEAEVSQLVIRPRPAARWTLIVLSSATMIIGVAFVVAVLADAEWASSLTAPSRLVIGLAFIIAGVVIGLFVLRSRIILSDYGIDLPFQAIPWSALHDVELKRETIDLKWETTHGHQKTYRVARFYYDVGEDLVGKLKSRMR